MEEINNACRAFAKSVNKYIDKAQLRRRRRRRGKCCLVNDRGGGGDDDGDNGDDGDDDATSSVWKECNELVRHANLVLKTLLRKLWSLAHALTALRAQSGEYLKRFAFSLTLPLEEGGGEKQTQAIEIVRRWFANYVRLQDGFVLLESGERWHEFDDHDDDDCSDDDDIITGKGHHTSSAALVFLSKLNGAYRPDGVTRKFKSKRGYTGRGYDEVYDEDVGILRRLCESLSRIDGGGGRGIKSVNEKLFDGDSTGASYWQGCMDEHIAESKALREDLNSIASDFVDGINRQLLTYATAAKTKVVSSAKGNACSSCGSVKKLTLISDDKFERINLGDLLNISRRGNDFSVKDRGGSLPIGMSVADWQMKFSLKEVDNAAVRKQPISLRNSKIEVEEVRTAKKRKMILEDSSEEEEDDNPTSKADTNNHSNMDCTAHEDGLMVRVQVPTDVSGSHSKSSESGPATSINEMKRQLGVNTMELQRGHELLEDDQLLSMMIANEEDKWSTF